MTTGELSSSEFSPTREPGGEVSDGAESANIKQSQAYKAPAVALSQDLAGSEQFPVRSDTRDNGTVESEPSVSPDITGKIESSAHKTGKSEDPGNQSETVVRHSTYLDMKGINWKKDLSPNGQWLFQELLIGAEDVQLLKQYAQTDGIDLDAAMKELDHYGFIDRTEPGFFHLPLKKLPARG